MKNISLILLFYIVQYCLTSSDIITMEVIGGIDRESIDCDADYVYSFNIPVTNVEGVPEGQLVSFPIPLLHPENTVVQCTLMDPLSENLKASDELYLHCEYNDKNNPLLYSRIEFAPTYQWETVEIVNWDSTIGKDAVVEEYAKCSISSADYDFAFFTSIKEECDSGYNDIEVIGGIINNGQEVSLTSSLIEERFELIYYSNNGESSASCILINFESNKSDAIDGSMYCSVKGSTIMWPAQIVETENEKTLFIAGKERYDLKYDCSSSWLSLSLLLFFALILI